MAMREIDKKNTAIYDNDDYDGGDEDDETYDDDDEEEDENWKGFCEREEKHTQLLIGTCVSPTTCEEKTM